MMRTLIAYSTKYGTTRKCAEYLQKLFGENTDIIDLKKTKNIDLSGYERIAVGGPMYMGMLNGTTKKFCVKYLSELKCKKLGLFLCHMEKEKTAREMITGQLPEEIIDSAVSVKGFGGAYKISEMNGLHKFIFTNVAKTTEDKDEINYAEIEAFARELE